MYLTQNVPHFLTTFTAAALPLAFLGHQFLLEIADDAFENAQLFGCNPLAGVIYFTLVLQELS